MIETFELLDRFELLYPENSRLSDLRRAYIDKDLHSIFRLLPDEYEELRKAVVEQNLHSIFRLIEGNVTGDIEDLRKAVVEQNLHSIFRLVDDEDLRKLLLEDNTWKLWPILDRYVDTQFTAAFKSFFVNETEIQNDCFSRGQLESKLWLVEELEKCNVDLGTVFLCAGWYATLATMLFQSNIKLDKVRSFDLDPSCVDIAEVFNKPWFVDEWKFKSITQNIMDINYNNHTWKSWSNENQRMSQPITDTPNTIINTSCEHIDNFEKWYAKIPSKKLVILQSNDFEDVEEHVNTHKTLKDFSDTIPMNNVLYEGQIELEKYNRFMKIGYK